MTEAQAHRTAFVALTLVLYFVANVAISWRRGGWKPLTWVIAAILAMDLLYARYYRDVSLFYYVLFGVVAGLFELPVDAWLVRSTKTLVYPDREPRIWASPAYMPFAWAVVLVQVAVLGDACVPIMPLAAATVLVATLAGLYIPIFEHLASGANLWWYRDTPMLFNAPYYVILAEFLLGLPLVWMGLQSEADRVSAAETLRVIGLGALEGLVVMFVAVLIAYGLVGKPRAGTPRPAPARAPGEGTPA